MADGYIGEIRAVGFNYAPAGWALCNGQLITISKQTGALFSLLGVTYGGDGIHNFALPNLQGRIALGMGEGQGLSPRPIGETAGTEGVTLHISEMPSHSHNVTPIACLTEASTPSPNDSVPANSGSPLYSNDANTLLGSYASQSTGENQPHNNLPPYLVVNYIICLQGTYPSKS
jgi:microcystin-dependent protein